MKPILLLLLLLALTGCQSVSYEHTSPTGETIRASAASFIEKVALQELDAQPGHIKARGYQQSGDAEMARQLMEGAAAGLVKGMKQ